MKTAYYPFKVTRGNVATFHVSESAAIKQARLIDGWLFRHDPFAPSHDHCDENGMWVAVERKPVYRKNSIEAKLDSLLPQFPSYDVIAHQLMQEGYRGNTCYSVNDSWHLARGCDREDAISHLANRWQVFKANYAPKARVRDLTDANYSGDEFPALLEVDGIPFAEVRNGGEE